MKKFIPLIFILGAISILLFLIKPALVGELNGTFKSTVFPGEYKNFESYLTSQKGFFRTLWFPAKQRFGFYSNLHPAISANELFKTNDILKLTASLKATKTEQVLKDLGVRYLVVPYDPQKEIFIKERKYSNLLYENTVKELQRISWLKEKTGFGQIKIFELKNYRDHFWTNSKNLLISYKNISPVEYVLSIDRAKQGDVIIFSESFDPKWVAIVDNITVPSFENKEKLNSFILPKNGSYTIKIYYEPQDFVNIGIIVSITTFVITTCTLLFLLMRRQIK